MVNKIPFNFDNFKRMQLEVEELRDLVLKLNARLTIRDTPDKVVVKKTKPKQGGDK